LSKKPFALNWPNIVVLLCTKTQKTSVHKAPPSSLGTASKSHVEPSISNVNPPGINSPRPISKFRKNITEPGTTKTAGKPSIDKIKAPTEPIRKTTATIKSVMIILTPYFFIAPLLAISVSALFILLETKCF